MNLLKHRQYGHRVHSSYQAAEQEEIQQPNIQVSWETSGASGRALAGQANEGPCSVPWLPGPGREEGLWGAEAGAHRWPSQGCLRCWPGNCWAGNPPSGDSDSNRAQAGWRGSLGHTTGLPQRLPQSFKKGREQQPTQRRLTAPVLFFTSPWAWLTPSGWLTSEPTADR